MLSLCLLAQLASMPASGLPGSCTHQWRLINCLVQPERNWLVCFYTIKSKYLVWDLGSELGERGTFRITIWVNFWVLNHRKILLAS
jgi:hypothetical protein